MPLDAPLAPIPRFPSLQPSAAIELTWLTVDCCGERSRFLERHPGLREQAMGFWDDGYGPLLETLACAQQLGCLWGWDVTPLLHLERHVVTVPADLTLETEFPEERDVIVARLERLAADAATRRSYSELLRILWTRAADEWSETGRVTVERSIQRMQASLDHGLTPLDLAPMEHCARREEFAPILSAAHASRSLVITPCYFAGERGHIVALPGVLSVAVGTGVTPDLARRRTDAERIAGSLKVLSDPTRLLILTGLDSAPATVGEIAQQVGVSQPTASVHVRQLREAGLIAPRRDGTRTLYHVERDRVRGLIRDAGSAVLTGTKW